MDLNKEILEVLQIIGGIYASRGIPAIPVNLDYLETQMAPDVEKLIVEDMIEQLRELMTSYTKKEKKVHKYANYVQVFSEILEENCHDNKILTRKTA